MVDVDKAHVVRYKSQGHNFEIFVDSDKAIEYRKGNIIDLSEVLAVDTIFSDAKKGLEVGHDELRTVFSEEDVFKVADIIIRKGDIPLTSEYKAHIREQKRKQIINIIHQNAVDPKNHLPIPISRLEAVFETAKINIDENKDVNLQVQEILKKIRPIIPIKFELKDIEVILSAEYASKSYGAINSFGKKLSEEWLSNGSYKAIVEIPGGMENDFYDKLNSLTHGGVQAKVINIK